MRALLIAIVSLAAVHTAYAYPQFQLSRDQTCTGCHISPSGGGLLNENGLNTVEAMSQYGTSPEFINGKLPLPSWLALGGDFRGMIGAYDGGRLLEFALFPMQADLYANVTLSTHLALHVTAGAQDPQYQNVGATLFGSREHWIQYQENPGEGNGMLLRVGRMMPVYGLRFVEHVDYNRNFGGTPLYNETYAASASYIQPKWELHATAFIRDPIRTDSVEQGNGIALYTECRFSESSSVGLESMFIQDYNDERTFYGVTGKHLLGSGILLQGEVQGIHQKIDAGGTANKAVAYGMGTYFRGALMFDLGLGYYNENVAVSGLDRDGIDLNVHGFTTSHIELILMNRVQFLDFGTSGTTSGYSMLQIHYRL
jgi:hypothetical protein